MKNPLDDLKNNDESGRIPEAMMVTSTNSQQFQYDEDGDALMG
jgi:hypothetical protein